MQGSYNKGKLETHDPSKEANVPPEERKNNSYEIQQIAGLVAHSILEGIIKHRNMQGDDIIDDVLNEYDRMKSGFDFEDFHHLRRLVPEDLQASPVDATVQEIQKKGIGLLEKWKEVRGSLEEEIEAEVRLSSKIGEREGSEVILLGRIDAIAEIEGTGGKVLIEFKTGSTKNIDEWFQQLEYYAHMYKEENDIEPEFLMVVHESLEIKQAIKRVSGMKKIEWEGYPKVNVHCKSCRLSSTCSSYQNSYLEKTMPG